MNRARHGRLWLTTSPFGIGLGCLRSANTQADLTIVGRRAYGRDARGNDHWDDAPPFVDGEQAVGFDCENLALWARRVMAEEFEDWSLGCARPTVCKLPDGQDHCVLTVVAESLGDYVIGAQHEEHFVPWQSLEGYQWFSRLEAGNEWRMVTG